MADPEHVERLKESVEAWNVWRQEQRVGLPILARAPATCVLLVVLASARLVAQYDGSKIY